MPYIEVYINFALGILGYCMPCLITIGIDVSLVLSIREKQLSRCRDKKQINKTTKTVLSFSVIYLLCYMPYSFVFLLLSLDLMPVNAYLIVFVTQLRYFNHVITFYIYLATGKQFRESIVKMFTKMKICWRI